MKQVLSQRETGCQELQYPLSFTSTNDRTQEEETEAQEEIFEARRSSLEAGIAILEQRIDQLNSQISGLTGLKHSKEILAISYQEELEDVSELLSQGFSDKNRLRELQRNVAQLDGEVAELVANIASTEVQVGESRLQIIQQERNFKTK